MNPYLMRIAMGTVFLAKNKDDGSNAPNADPKADAKTEPETEGGGEIGPSIEKKLTPSTIMGKMKKSVMEGTIKLPSDLYTIIGRAANIRDGESEYGPWSALLGEFEAQRLSDGQTFIGTQCFVPGPAGDLLVSQVRKFVQEEVPCSPEEYKLRGKTYKVTGETVEFALVIGARMNEREGGAPYEFTVKPLIDVRKADPLAALRDKVSKNVKLLAAPRGPVAAG